MRQIDQIFARIGRWLGIEIEEGLPADALLSTRSERHPAAQRADAIFEELRASCHHLEATGVDDTPTIDPAKVWRCDNCGLLHRHLLDPEKPWVTLGIEPVEATA